MDNKIKLVREALKLSQKEFGENLGVSRDVISNIEYGRVAPKELFLQHMCERYKVNRAWIDSSEGDIFYNETNENKYLREAKDLLNELSPELQNYALKQIKLLLELQNSSKEGK